MDAERDEVDRQFEVVQTGTDEVAVVYHNDRLTAILGPNERALYWRGVVSTVVKRYSLMEGPAISKSANRQLFEKGDARTLATLSRAILTTP